MSVVKITDLPAIDSPLGAADVVPVVQNDVTKKAQISDIRVNVSALPAATSPLASTDIIPVVQGGVEKKAQISDIELSSTQVSFLQSGSGATARTVQSRLREEVSVKDFGAVGDGVADDTAAIQAAIDSIERGILVFPPGEYKTTSTINIVGKNDQIDATQSSFEIRAYGATIFSTVTGSTPAVSIRQCKRLIMRALEISTTSTLGIQVEGMWNSTWDSCYVGNVQFSSLGNAFDANYWNKFQECLFGVITINTGGGGNLSEFNANTFDTCRIWGGDYAIKKFGAHRIEDVTFINCDISYQTNGILYVDEATDGSLSFFGGYFDTAPGFPADTKGIQLDFNGSIWNPNSANVNTFVLNTASKSQSKSGGGVRTGDRLPTSSYNLIINGDLRAGTVDLGLSNVTGTITSGTGVFGQYINLTTSTAFGTTSFYSMSVPVSGVYTLTIIGRVNTAGDSVLSCAGVFGPVSFGSDWTISSFSTTIAQGNTVTFKIENGATGSYDYDIAYVGLTYGRSSPLYAPIHPSADRYSPGTQLGGFTNVKLTSTTMGDELRTQVFSKAYTASTGSTDILLVTGVRGHMTFEVDVFYEDIASPNGTFIQKLYVATRGSGTTVTSAVIAKEDKVKDISGSATDYLTWTATASGTGVMLAATAPAATGGVGALIMRVSGSFSSATVQ